MNTEQERAEFEAWATSQWLVLQRTVHGEDYQDLRTQVAWEAYQAGRAAGIRDGRAALQSQDRREWLNTLERKAEALWVATAEDRHQAMRDLVHHASVGPRSQDREDDPLQPAADWLVKAIDGCQVGDIQHGLRIGHNRAQRLFGHARRIEGD